MLDCLSGSPPQTKHIRYPRLWLHAARIQISDCALIAAEGFVAQDGLQCALKSLSSQKDPDVIVPEGHFSMAAWVLGSPRLTLFRSFSGGERLYVACTGSLVIFASTLRPILAYSHAHACVNMSVLDEALLTGLPVFGQETLCEGVDEVLPGHGLVLGDEVGRQWWYRREVLRSAVGEPDDLARTFRDRLTEAVAASGGRDRPVAVALSGGIDSSAIAAAAVEAFGADQVVCYSYEFDDVTHSVETHYAREVCQHLGITKHRVFPISFEDFQAAIPETIWRSESFVNWPKAFMLPVARYIRDCGHDRYLTGFGIGSHMSYMRELASVLSTLPFLRHGLRYWKSARFMTRLWPHSLNRIHPGLEPPHPRLYLMLIRLLHHAGLFEDVCSWFPEPVHPMLQRLRDLDTIEPSLGGLSLAEQFQLQAFSHLLSCIDVTRSDKVSREVGIYRVSPAHFASCIPYAYFPVEPAPAFWSRNRDLRPGKYLLRLAYEDRLPRSVLYRKKSWGDAVATPAWLREGRLRMLQVLHEFPDSFERFGPGYTNALLCWEPMSVLASGLSFSLWEKIFQTLQITVFESSSANGKMKKTL